MARMTRVSPNNTPAGPAMATSAAAPPEPLHERLQDKAATTYNIPRGAS